MSNSKLHIFGPTYYHDHSFIIGNREALELLRKAIDDALETGSATGKTSAFAADGEGFDLCVYREEEDAFWEKALFPYTDNDAQDNREDAIGPWQLFRKYKT